MGEHEGGFYQEPRASEVYVEMAEKIERAVGKPGWVVLSVFGAAAIGTKDKDGKLQLALSAASWPDDDQKRAELRWLLRQWLDEADDQANQ
jgi:hypothetical protein